MDEEIRLEAYKLFLMRLTGLKEGEILDIVPTPGFNPQIKAPSKSMLNFLKNLESWGHLDEDEQKIVLDKITNMVPISSGCSLHVCEERYVINGETYRTIEAIGYDGITVEILKTKK